MPVGAQVAPEGSLPRGDAEKDVSPAVDAVEADSPPVDAGSARKSVRGEGYSPPPRRPLQRAASRCASGERFAIDAVFVVYWELFELLPIEYDGCTTGQVMITILQH